MPCKINTMNKPDFLSMDIPALAALLTEWGEPAYRGRQIFQWLQQKGVTDFNDMSNLPLSLRGELTHKALITAPCVLRRQESAAGDTVKLLLEYADGARIETVLMLYEKETYRDRATCCVSTQNGCAMGCAFCASSLYRAPRNLSAGEMAAQVLLTAGLAREKGFAGITNVVFMGMGEPLVNLVNLRQAILLLNDENGQNIGQRRITVSTCGLAPQIYELADWGLQISLAVSLHAADAAKRARLMPVAARYSLAELLAACRYYRQKTGRRVTVEYAMFAGVNDSLEDAALLADLLAGEDMHINIIPANSITEAGFLPSKREIIERFCAYLREQGREAAVREARGPDIGAACGQLRGN